MKVLIYRIIKRTAGGFHSWCESNVGKIRKPNNNIQIAKWYEIWWSRIVELFRKLYSND